MINNSLFHLPTSCAHQQDCEAHAYCLTWHGDQERPGRSLGMFKAVVELPDRNLKRANNSVMG